MKNKKFIVDIIYVLHKSMSIGLIFTGIILLLLFIYNSKLLSNKETLTLEVITINSQESNDVKNVNKTPTPEYVSDNNLMDENMKHELEQLKHIEDDILRFIKYKGIIYRYAENIESEDDPTYNLQKLFSFDEIFLIQRTIETECFDMDFMSKVNVASVILNRIKDGRFGNTVEEIITSPNQFAYDRRYISYDTVLALEYASYFGDTTNGCIAFRSGNKPDKWDKWTLQFTDNSGHGFYK